MKKKIPKLLPAALIAVMVMTAALSIVAVPVLGSSPQKVTLNMNTLSSYYKNHHNVPGGMAFDSNITVFKIGGEYAFCTQAGYGIRDASGNPWDGRENFASEYAISQVTGDNSKASKIAYLGFLQYKDDPELWNDVQKRNWRYAMTQMMIWQELPVVYNDNGVALGAHGMTNGKYNSYFKNAETRADYNKFKQKVQAKLDTWYTRPSFNGLSKYHDINAGETITLTDSNNVLEDYDAFTYSQDGITVKHEKRSNVISVKASKTCQEKKVLMPQGVLKNAGAQKYNSEAKINYTYSAERSQNLAVYGYVDPIDLALSFNVDLVTGRIAIEKTKAPDASSSSSKPEAGAKFQIYLKSAGSYANATADRRDILTTDSAGKAQSKELRPGTYTVHQTAGAKGHKLSKDFDVVISADNPDKVYTYKLNNETLKSNVRIVKKDAETGKTVAKAGTKYKITNLTTNKDIGTYTTDSTGTLTLENPLYYGEYKLTELTAPIGYKKAAPSTFTVDGSEGTLTVNQSDYAQQGRINLQKTGDVFQSVTKKDNTYTPEYGSGSLQGAVFEVRAAENITTPDGTVRVKKGALVDTLTTGKDGSSKSKLLYLGKYNVKETKAPHGYVLNSETYPVELKYAGQDVSVASSSMEASNVRQKAKITLNKEIEEDELFGLEAQEAFEKVRFGLYAAETMTAADGSVIPKDGLIETIGITRAEEGETAKDNYALYTGAFTKDLPLGKYYVKEIKTDEHYIIDNNKYPVEFSYQGQDTKAVNISVNDGNAITNDLIRGRIEGVKVTDDGNNLGGALIGLFKDEISEYTEESAILTTTSADDGSFSFENVPYGHYRVREIKAPYGYILNDAVWMVEITEDGQIEKIEMENKVQTGLIKVEKKGEILKTIKEEQDMTYTPVYEEAGLEGAEFTITAAEDIYTGDKVLRYKKGDTVEVLTTDGDGLAVSSNLYIGKYQVQETRSPYGYVLNPAVYDVEIKYAGQEVEVASTETVHAGNERQKAKITLKKLIEEDGLFGFLAEAVYKNVKFGLYAAEEITAADGTIIPKDGLIEVIGVTKVEESSGETSKPDALNDKSEGSKPPILSAEGENKSEADGSSESGYASYGGSFSKDLPLSKLYVKEIETDEGYILGEEQYPVEFSYQGQDESLVELTATAGEAMKNDIIRGDILGYKTGDKESPLSGAVFGLFKMDEKHFTKENAFLIKNV